jgi:hypothetical protein
LRPERRLVTAVIPIMGSTVSVSIPPFVGVPPVLKAVTGRGTTPPRLRRVSSTGVLPLALVAKVVAVMPRVAVQTLTVSIPVSSITIHRSPLTVMRPPVVSTLAIARPIVGRPIRVLVHRIPASPFGAVVAGWRAIMRDSVIATLLAVGRTIIVTSFSAFRMRLWVKRTVVVAVPIPAVTITLAVAL